MIMTRPLSTPDAADTTTGTSSTRMGVSVVPLPPTQTQRNQRRQRFKQNAPRSVHGNARVSLLHTISVEDESLAISSVNRTMGKREDATNAHRGRHHTAGSPQKCWALEKESARARARCRRPLQTGATTTTMVVRRAARRRTRQQTHTSTCSTLHSSLKHDWMRVDTPIRCTPEQFAHTKLARCSPSAYETVTQVTTTAWQQATA
jgi:hypothetical protein